MQCVICELSDVECLLGKGSPRKKLIEANKNCRKCPSFGECRPKICMLSLQDLAGEKLLKIYSPLGWGGGGRIDVTE